MLNLIYSGALTSLLFGIAVLIRYEDRPRISRLVRSLIIISSIAYAISFSLFSEPIVFKSTIFLRDVTLIFCVIVTFRIIRNAKFSFPILLTALILGMSNFGFNHVHDSFKISKFSVLKEANASTNVAKKNKDNVRKTSKLATKSSKN